MLPYLAKKAQGGGLQSYLIGSMGKGSFAMLLLKSEILHGGVGCHLKPFGVCALSSVFSL